MIERYLFCLLLIAFSSCDAPEVSPTLTQRDAVQFGFSAISCEGGIPFPVFIMPDSIARATACQETDMALSAAKASGILGPGRLEADSVAIAVVERTYFGSSGYSVEDVRAGFGVTFDLLTTDTSVVVDWEGEYVNLSVEFVPEGLRY